ncbi:putative Fels-2 prophage protein [Xenorhabdus bovienii str. oregonense]|uniref:Putative Fels-2 prophage protein n=1 Tax=Xenorhabdus bovienii str. oregonense TaxID=1398202 RepID=A0A077P4V9_XENBV|nr:hypothetical protein [Xenorhabdus bovienii]CDH06110.1 putative Fels-2 prophage protein [Xenorhabdus bovienii str. oregonense]
MTNQPSPKNTPFEVNYSFYLEEMTGIFNHRCNQFCSFIQLFLGASVFANTQLGWLFGLIIAFISALQFGFKFGEKAGNAKAQVSRYRILLDEIPNLSESEIIKQMQSIEKSDTQVLSSLYNPARKRASIALHGRDLESDTPLTKLEKISAIIGGGIPR